MSQHFEPIGLEFDDVEDGGFDGWWKAVLLDQLLSDPSRLGFGGGLLMLPCSDGGKEGGFLEALDFLEPFPL